MLACGGSAPRDATGTTTAKGQFGVYYLVTVFRPDNGVVDSTEAAHKIHCGPAGTGADACGPTQFLWAETATLVATPSPGYGFQAWAGSCSTAGSCVLTAGADKFVVAIFQPVGQVGHPNWASVTLHGPAYLDYLGNVSGSLNCATASCHGTSLQGVGVAPNCFDCHAQAGWTSWQTNCAFCHGATTPEAKAGFVVADSPGLAAPPHSVRQRLDPTHAPDPTRTGEQQSHLAGRTSTGIVMSPGFRCETCHPVPTNLTHVRGSTARAVVILSGASQGQLPANLGSYNATAGTCLTYCHGKGFATPGTSPAWGSGPIACNGCHGFPPPLTDDPGHPQLTNCNVCHPTTVKPDGTIDPAGTHLNGKLDITGGGACNGCHGFPPATGAHAKHDGLTDLETNPSNYGDLRTLEQRTAATTPTTAPTVYAFGCGNCHPLDGTNHMNGNVDIELYNVNAGQGSLKARSSPSASFNSTAKTCSGTYCHSSGQENPTFGTTPGWSSGTHVACNGCHTNPPAYDTGTAGGATANSHVNLAVDGYEYGHFLGIPGQWHPGSNNHGGHLVTGEDAAPITCQTCHFDTTDPANTGPSGFYYLDTSGNYQLPGGYAPRTSDPWYAHLQCTLCHSASNPAAPTGTGKVLPLRHVNGTREVVFDPRGSLPGLGTIPWLPAAPNTPTKPYWETTAATSVPWPSYVSFDGTTVSFSVAPSAYDRTTKTCSNVACHLAESPVWGTRDGAALCVACHPPHFTH